MDKTHEKEKCTEKWGENREVKQLAKVSTVEKERKTNISLEQGGRGIDFDRKAKKQ